MLKLFLFPPFSFHLFSAFLASSLMLSSSPAYATRLGDMLEGIKIAPVGIEHSISTITETSSVNGMVYTVGWDNSNRGLALEWDPQTGQGREILLNDLSNLTGARAESFARVYGVSQLGGETFFLGQSKNDQGSVRATLWSASGIPSESEFATRSGVFHQMTETGYLTGSQAGAGVVWTPNGGGHILPLTPLAEVLNYGSNGLDITPDGRYISGQIGSDAVVWRANGDPANSNYELMFYNEGPFPYRFKALDDGFGPNAGGYILDSDLFGTVMITNYGSSTGARSGAWSVETGLDFQTFGHSTIMDAINIDGNVYIATNDFTENSGALWLLGDSNPLYLRDLFAEYAYENIFFTPGGLFEGSLGMLLQAELNGAPITFLSSLFLKGENINEAAAPEPGTLLLLLGGGIPLIRRKLKKS